MMKTVFLIIIFNCSLSYANFIDYYAYINEAEYHMNQGNYDVALINFTSGFNEVEKAHARDYYFAARCCAQLRQDEQLFFFLKEALKTGLQKQQIVTDSLWFTDYRFTNEFIDITESAYSFPTSDSLYIDKLQKLGTKLFNNTFSDLDSIKNAFGEHSTEFKNYQNLLSKNRAEVSQEFFTFFLNNDLPNLFGNEFFIIDTKTKIGSKLKYEFLKFFFWLFNADANNKQLVLDKLHLGLTSGKIPPVMYALIIDRYLKLSGEPIKYGVAYQSIIPKSLPQITENRRSIGVSTYYAASPNYDKYILDSDITYNYRH